MKKNKRLLALICAVLLLVGAAPMSLAVGSPTSAGNTQPYAETNHPYDTAVMTFNVLTDNSGTAKYDTPANRLHRIVGLIENYAPAVVNVQEAPSTYYLDDASTLSWHDALAEELGKLGYGYVSFKSITGYNQSVQRGLMIFYKTDRFTADTNGWGSLNATATYNGVTARHPYDRAYIYTRLLDKEYGNQPVYFFNTHFAIDVSTDTSGNAITDSTTINQISADIRTQQSVTLATAVQNLADGHPFFVSGDYNIGLVSSYSDTYLTKPVAAQYRQLLTITDTYSVMKPAAVVAKRTLNTDIYGKNTGKVWTGIDHIYINTDLQTVTDYQTLSDHIDGRRPSDHLPRIAYCSYRPAITAATGTYDQWEGTYEHTVSADSLTLSLTVPTGVTYALGNNAVGNNTISLPAYKNTFDIKLYNDGVLYDTIPATVINTAASKPTVTADGATNVYFAGGAYHVVLNKATTAVTPTVTDGTLYSNATCTAAVTTLTADGARATFYLQAAGGEVFPLYLYHETADINANSKVVYIDDDTVDATGTVAFYDGENTVLGTAGTKIFSDYPQVVTGLRSGTYHTVYFAGGHYTGNSTAFTDAINKSVTLIGNNANIEANQRLNTGWKENPDRKEESVIHGGIRLYHSASTDYDITIKGFTFEDQGTYGSIYAEAGAATQTVTLDIQNNIFAGWGYNWKSADLWLNNPTRKTGTIKGNYFKTTGNRVLSENDSNNLNSYYNRRGIFARNFDGVVMENNRFVGQELPVWLHSEISDGNTTAGNATYTLKNNRFELCDHLELYVKNITAATGANLNITGNDFLRCGNQTGCGFAVGYNAIYLQYLDSGAGIDFSKCSLQMTHNTFEECTRTVRIIRSTDNDSVLAMPITITHNRFVPNDQHNQTDYLKETLDLAIHTGGNNPTNWNLRYNHFSSAYLLKGAATTQTNNNLIVPDVNDPSLFINTNSFYTLDRSVYTPYYSDFAMTTLICDHDEGRWETVTEATATTEGEKVRLCNLCDAELERAAIPATGAVFIGSQGYPSLAKALAAATAGQTVMLKADLTETEVILHPGITLDLNGHTLRVTYLVGMNTSALIDSQETGNGKLFAAAGNVLLSESNPYLPIYDGANGCYLFSRVKNDRNTVTAQANGLPHYATSPMVKDYVHPLLNTVDAAESSGVDVIIRLRWIDQQGQYDGSQDYTYRDAQIAQVFASYVSENGEVNYESEFYGIFTGSEIAEGISVTVSTVVRSAAGVEMESSPITLFD